MGRDLPPPHVTAYSTKIELKKTAATNGFCPGTDSLAVQIGDNVTYCFNVTNTGDVTLRKVAVNDDHYGAIALGTTTLAPGETTGGTVTHVVVESDVPSVTNTATATGTNPLGGTVTDTDDCRIDVAIAPDIAVFKTASLTGSCPGSDPLAVNIGDTVTYCYNVTNTGDVSLTSVTVNDDIYGSVTLVNTALAPGETTEGTLTHVVLESDVPSVTNTATATGTDPLGGTVTDTDDCRIDVAIAPDIEVVKTASLTGSCPGSDPLAVNIGDTVTYCYNVTNTGDVSLTGVTVNDDKYGSVTLVNTALAPGETTEGTLTHVVLESDAPSVTNTATATGTDPLEGTVTDTDDCRIDVAIAPDIEVVKTASLTGSCPGSDPLAVNIGDTVTYCYNVSNTGDVSLTSVTVNDDIYGSVTLVNTALAPGETTGGTITHVVLESDVPSVTNTATADATDPDYNVVSDTDNCTINVAYSAEIELEKTASTNGFCPGTDPLTVQIGDNVTYCFNVTNKGDVTLTDVSVIDDHYGALALGTTTLAPGESTSGTVSHIVTESDVPSVTNTATADATDPDYKVVSDFDDCTINVAYSAKIELEKTASTSGFCPGTDPLTVQIGDNVTYCFNVTNTGDVTLTDVSVIDDHYGAIALGTTTLAPGETTGGTVTHVVVESDVPSVTNTATATGTDPLEGTVTDTDDCRIDVAIAPDIEVVKTASLTGSCPGSDPLAVNIGDTVTYCYNVSNTGDVSLTSVTVNDDMYGSVTLGTTTLAPGETTEGTLTHVVLESDVPSVTNTATATGADPLEGTVTDTDDCRIDVAIAPDIEVVKTVSLTGSCPGSDPLAVNIGDTVTYCYNVTNTGDVSLTSVTVNDDKYGSVTLVNTSLAPGETTEGTLTHVVLESDAPSVTNTATATGTDPLEGTVTDTDDCRIDVAIAPDIEVVKTASLTGSCPGSDPLAVNIGDTVTYCYNVTNTGDVSLTSVTVNDDIYGSVTLVNTALAPGETTEGTLTHVVVESDVPSVTNTATATGTDPLEGTVTDTDDCRIDVAIAPDIEVVKTASLTGSCPGSDPLAVNIGDTVTYCYNVTNTGDVSLTSVTVNDDIYGSVTLVNTALAPGETTEGTLTHVVLESDAPSVTNTATATGTDPLEGTVTDTDDCRIDVAIAPDIEVVKTASLTGSCPGSDPLAVNIGDTVTYCYNVTNTGDVSLTSVTVNDDMYGSVTLGTTTLAPGETTEGTLTHVVLESDVPSVTNTATVDATDPDYNVVSDTDDCTINVEYAEIELEKTASTNGVCPGTDPLTVQIGDNVTYCFNVTNTGVVTLTEVSVIDDHYGAIALGTTTLAPGESTSGTVSHIVTEPDVPSVTNTATADATDPDYKVVSDTDDCTINVEYAAIELEKTASTNGGCPGTDPLTVQIGDNVTYCFNVTNTGVVTLTDVSVIDEHYGAIALGTTTLAPGERTGGTVTHVVVESDVPSVTNTATATGTDPLEGTVTDTDDCRIEVAIAPDIEVVKTASLTGSCPGSDPLAVNIGDAVTYCYNVSNTGDVTLTNVTVNDDKYGPVTLLNTSLAPGETTGGTITHVVLESDVPSVTNTATADATAPDYNAVSDTDDCTINVAYSAEIELEKTASTNGFCPGTDPLTVQIGDNVTYCFSVTNKGDVTLTDVSVIDDHYGAIALVATTLAPGESTSGTVSHIVTKSDVPSVTNTATVDATDPDYKVVSDSDDCTINVEYAAIELEKTASTNGVCPGTDPLTVQIGDNVTYCFNVTNTGDVTFREVAVIDDHYGAIALGTTTLAPGETTVGTVTHVVVESDIPSVTNTATATGTDPLGGTVTDTDDCRIDVARAPDIEVVMTASLTGSCPGSDPLAVNIGDTVTYCYNVTNTGDVPLTSVTVNDDMYGSVTLGTTTLAPGETTGGTVTHVVVESDVPSVTNTATVDATDPDYNVVSDFDDCTIHVEPSPCFIATAAYGTALHEDIDVLREFRDEYLVTNPAGRVFVKIYYTTSPPVAALIRNNEGLSTSVREVVVKPLVYITRRFVKGGSKNG